MLTGGLLTGERTALVRLTRLRFMKSLDLIFSSWFALRRWKHAAACHHDSTLQGEGDYYETDAV